MPAGKVGGKTPGKVGAEVMGGGATGKTVTKVPKTLYLVHGWTYTTEPWAKTRQILAANGVKTKMLHVPGLTEPSRRVWNIAEYADWADRQIPDGAVVLGHSNGGRILLNLCANHPEKLRKLILLSSAGVYTPSKKRAVMRKLSKVFAPVGKIPGAKKLVHKLLGAQDYGNAPENMKRTLANMIASDKELDVTGVRTPTVLLWGEDDKTTPLSQGKKLAELLPRAVLKTYKGWKHAPYLTHPEELACAILTALKTAVPEDIPAEEQGDKAEKSAQSPAKLPKIAQNSPQTSANPPKNAKIRAMTEAKK